MNKAAKPLKIFISYGHEIGVKDKFGNPLYPKPNNENVVLKIKAYLESRGHEVWLDKERIKPGSEWRKSIYEGVEWSDVALICLSRKAMKLNGVCRDEISIAMGVRGGNMFPIKLEALEDSEYPAYLLNRQLFTQFMDWRLHSTEDSIDEIWLDKNLEELAKALEEKDVWRYGVEMVELKNILKPWNMSSRLKSLDRETQCLFNGQQTNLKEEVTVHKFCGRQSLFEMFDGKIAQSGQAVRIKAERVLWLKKGPGFGKSRFAAELLYRRYYTISAAYFIEYNQRETLDPHTFVKSVAYQLAQANSAYRGKLLKYLKDNQDEIKLQMGDPQTLFKTLVVDLLSDEIDGGRATQWILVDALDEATENNRNEIASLISQNLDRLPPWICFFITSRDRDNAVNRNFAQFTPIDFQDEENENDVRDYILNEFKGMNITVSEELVNILQEKSEGTFLYPRMVIEDLNKKSFSLDDIHDLPKGVIGYIHKQFDRLFGKDLESYENIVRPMLGFILTSCEPISRAVLKYCLGISRDSELDKRLKALGTFFIQSGSTDEDTVIPFHKSVIDYCFDKDRSEDYYVYPDEAKEDFANRGLEMYKSGALQWTTRTDIEPNTVQQYFLNWLPSHLMNANMTKEAADVLSDFAFLMKRLRYGNVERVLQDYFLFRRKLDQISKDSDAFFDVICGNAHFLRRNSEDNPAYKIILQIAAEVADDCPVTQAAERWLNPKEGDSPCDWFWLNKVNRPKEYQPNPCKLVIEKAGDNAMLLSNGDVLSWGPDSKLKIWDIETGVCKKVLEEHRGSIKGAIELRSKDILSWGTDRTLRIWSPDGKRKTILTGHKHIVSGATELSSGDILSWSPDTTLRLWSPEGTCKAVMKGYSNDHEHCKQIDFVTKQHTSEFIHAIELSSGDILSWSPDTTLRLWSPEGMRKAVLEGHTDEVSGAIELHSSGNILSWSSGENSLRLWSPNGDYKTVLEGHAGEINGAIELSSGDILSWSNDKSLRIWSPEGICKTVLKGHKDHVWGARELNSGDILSWGRDSALRIWSKDGNCKVVLKGHTSPVHGAIELSSGDILSWSHLTMNRWSSDGTCKAVLEGSTFAIKDAIELNSGYILSWGLDLSLRLWSSSSTYKVVFEGHNDWIGGAIELASGNILSWSNDKLLRLWSPEGNCIKLLKGHTKKIIEAVELSSGNILSWSWDHTLRIWSCDGICKAVLEEHKDKIKSAIELRSKNILSWCEFGKDFSMHLWSPDRISKVFFEGHTDEIEGAIELSSGDILSWSDDTTLRLWSPDGMCKAVLRGHKEWVDGAIELHSGDILSWSSDTTLRLWSPNGTCKAVLEGHKLHVSRAIELPCGDILSMGGVLIDENGKEHVDSLRLWSSDGKFKEIIDSQNPNYNLFYSLLYNNKINEHFYAKESDRHYYGIELQHEFKLICLRNNPSSLYRGFRFVGAGRLCVWYGQHLDFLQLNYGNHMSISFKQADQFLTGEIDESQLVTYVSEPKGTAIPKTE